MADSGGSFARLEEVERDDSRPPFRLTPVEIRLLAITGVGFFLDSYDLFIINQVSTMLQFRLYPNGNAPPVLMGFLKAAANIGAVIGQFSFGYLADSLGRKAVYGKELMLIIFATIMCLTTPTGRISPNACLVYLAVWRIVLGIGVGGDYPMSASVTSDRANLRKRGTMLAYIFANQGWGNFVGSIVVMVVLAAYKPVMDNEGHMSKVDGVWRICIGLSLVPAFGTLYQRLTLAESTRFERSRHAYDVEDVHLTVPLRHTNDASHSQGDHERCQSGSCDAAFAEQPVNTGDLYRTQRQDYKKHHFDEVWAYFSEWRHFKILLGTSLCWFLLDIAFYGINLNENVVLENFGLAGSGSSWTALFKVSKGNLIITALGFLPGYYVTVLTIERLGRKKIQIMGFLMEALFFAILAGKFHSLSKAAFVVNFALLQFFFNFGANVTTYVYPAEVFPTKFRAFAHGTSAACGKVGAIISALAFNELSKKDHTPRVLWIFFACCLAGAFATLLLPEVMDRDPDLIYEEELRARRYA